LITESDRKQVIALVEQAFQAGCRRAVACRLLGFSVRTLQRWEASGLIDQRKGSRAKPANALSAHERRKILDIVASPEYRDMSPQKIVPSLADAGVYLGSESTMYRILRENKLLCHRGAAKPVTRIRPKALVALGPNEIWSWDIAYLPTTIQGAFFYLYLIIDIFSRKIVGWQIHETESAGHAAALVKQTCLDECLINGPLALHSDNGSPMKGATMLAILQQLGVMASFSRPSVSNDNPYSESLFRTVKYCPQYPERPFERLIQAREWMIRFVDWYNHSHQHSGIKFVTPDQRHRGEDKSILEQRDNVYRLAKQENPARWSGKTRNWSWNNMEVLNPSSNTMKRKEIREAA
jgi:putative transposase